MAYSTQDVVNSLKKLVGQYTNSGKKLNNILDDKHHAFVKREYGQNKELVVVIANLQTIIHTYDTVTYTLSYDLGDGTGSVPTAQEAVEGGTVNLRNSAGIIPPVGMKFICWSPYREHQERLNYKPGQKYIMPGNNITLYAVYEQKS